MTEDQAQRDQAQRDRILYPQHPTRYRFKEPRKQYPRDDLPLAGWTTGRDFIGLNNSKE